MKDPLASVASIFVGSCAFRAKKEKEEEGGRGGLGEAHLHPPPFFSLSSQYSRSQKAKTHKTPTKTLATQAKDTCNTWMKDKSNYAFSPTRSSDDLSRLTMEDRKSNFVFALGCLCKCMRNKSRLAAICFSVAQNLPRFDARI